MVTDDVAKNIQLPKELESVPTVTEFPSERHRWNTNEVIQCQVLSLFLWTCTIRTAARCVPKFRRIVYFCHYSSPLFSPFRVSMLVLIILFYKFYGPPCSPSPQGNLFTTHSLCISNQFFGLLPTTIIFRNHEARFPFFCLTLLGMEIYL